MGEAGGMSRDCFPFKFDSAVFFRCDLHVKCDERCVLSGPGIARQCGWPEVVRMKGQGNVGRCPVVRHGGVMSRVLACTMREWAGVTTMEICVYGIVESQCIEDVKNQ
jgi:hypothetical protein